MPKYNELNPDILAANIITKKVIFNLPRNVRFKCVKCGNCCKTNRSPLNPRDIRSLKKLGCRNFIAKDTRGDSLDGRVLRHIKDRCMFLDHNNRCTIWRHRPLICRTYPFSIVGYNEPLKRIVATYMVEGGERGKPFVCNGFYNGAPVREDILPYIKPIIDLWNRISIRARKTINQKLAKESVITLDQSGEKIA